MAAVTHAVATASAANANTYTTGAFTPAAGDLLVVFAYAASTIDVGAVTNSDGLTFTKIASITTNNEGTETIYCFVADQLANAVSQTCTLDVTGDIADGATVAVARVDGMTNTGAAAVRQSDTGFGGGGAQPSTVFAAAALTGNPTLGVVGANLNPPALTAPTGWTEQVDTGHDTPTRGLEYVSRDSGFTGTTMTWSGGTTKHGEISIELDASGAAVGQPYAKRTGGVPGMLGNRNGVW